MTDANGKIAYSYGLEQFMLRSLYNTKKQADALKFPQDSNYILHWNRMTETTLKGKNWTYYTNFTLCLKDLIKIL